MSDTIAQQNIDVNSKHQKLLKLIKNYVLMQPVMAPYRGDVTVDYSGNINYEFDNPIGQNVSDCPFSVPPCYRIPHVQVKRARGPRKHPSEKYPVLYGQAEAGSISDWALVDAYTKRMSERPLIYYHSPSNDVSVFRGKVKGSDEYSEYITKRINDCSAALVANYKYHYFLTQTYDYKTYGTDIVQAWKTFNRQQARFFKALRKRFKMEYVCVLEATKKGYPHAHIILGTNEVIDKWHEKLGDGHSIRNGRLYNFIQSHVASPVFKLQKAGGKGLVKYLGKYVAKGLSLLLPPPGGDISDISAPCRKALLSLFMPILAGVRQYRFSIRGIKKVDCDCEDVDDEDLEVLSDCIQMGMASPEGDAALIRLLNNLPLPCLSHVWIILNSKRKEELSEHVGYYSKPPWQVFKQFQENGYPLGCPGCALSVFVYNLQCFDDVYMQYPGYTFAKALYNAKLAATQSRRKATCVG